MNPSTGGQEILAGSEKTNTILRFDANTGVYLGTSVPPGSGSLQDPTGFVIAPDRSIFVSGGASNEILRYRGTDGQFLASITPEPLNAPQDSVLGPDGYLYAVSRDADAVARYDATSGKFLGNFVASGSGGLNVPTGLVFTPDHSSLLVASSFNSSVLKYSAVDGSFQGVFIASTNGSNGGLSDPEGLVFRNGNLFVTSTKSFTIVGSNGASDFVASSGTVLEYNGTTGAFIKAYTPEPLFAPESAVIGLDKNLYVSSSASNEVIKYNGTTGQFISIFVSSDPAVNGGLSDPRGIAFDAVRGLMYVSSYGTSTVLSYDASTGRFMGLLTPEPEKAPQGTAFFTDLATSKTYFYVASRDGNDILKYDGTTGKYLGEFVSSNPALNGGLKKPEGIAFDGAGKLYVSSKGTNQVLLYNPNGTFKKVFADGSNPLLLGDLVQPEYLTIRNSQIYVGTSGTDEVLRFNLDGSFAPGVPNAGAEFVAPGLGGLNGPEGLAFDGTGNLYVASNFTNQVLEYNPDGSFQRIFVAGHDRAARRSKTPIFNPVGLAFHNFGGGLGTLLLVSGGTGDHSFVQAYDASTSTFVGSLLTPGAGGLNGPTSIIFSPVDGTFLVANTATSDVLQFGGPIDDDYVAPVHAADRNHSRMG